MSDGIDLAKRAAGEAALTLVEQDMVVGLGTGSTARWFILGLAALVREGLRITGVPTSRASAALASAQGIPLVELDQRGIDLAVDGADSVDGDLRLIKGFGGAMVRERIVAVAAERFVVIVDEGKLCSQLAGRVPVEILPFAAGFTISRLRRTGADFTIRRGADGEAVSSDNHNLIADGEYGAITEPEVLAARLSAIPGVVGHGLFVGLTSLVLAGRPDGTVRRVPARS